MTKAIEAGKVYRTKEGLRVVVDRDHTPGIGNIYLNDANGYPLPPHYKLADLTGPLAGVQAAVKGSVLTRKHNDHSTFVRDVIGVCGEVLFLRNGSTAGPAITTYEAMEAEGYTLRGSTPADDGYAYRADGTRLGKVVGRRCVLPLDDHGVVREEDKMSYRVETVRVIEAD
jgi:hypothetical protein